MTEIAGVGRGIARDGLEAVETDQRSPGGIGQGLGRRQSHPQAGIRAGPQADREHVDVVGTDTSFAQRGRQPGNKVAPMAAPLSVDDANTQPDRTDRPIDAAFR